MASDQTIELDCAPFMSRPDTYIARVIEGTGLPERKDSSRFFGNWVWDYNDIDEATWKKIQPTLKARIEKLYNSGAIRYGSW